MQPLYPIRADELKEFCVNSSRGRDRPGTVVQPLYPVRADELGRFRNYQVFNAPRNAGPTLRAREQLALRHPRHFAERTISRRDSVGLLLREGFPHVASVQGGIRLL